METGSAIFFDEHRGFGFIRPDLGGADLFVHARALNGASALATGQRCEFETEHDAKRGKDRAINVRPIR